MASDSTIEVLQGELERLFELDELKALTADVLGFDPEAVGGTGSKGAFARSLVGYCADQEATDALVDAILLSSDRAEPELRATVKSKPNGELKPGTRVGDMRIVKKIGEGGISVVYLAELESEGGEARRAALKVIRPQYSRDPAAVHRFTTVSRIMQRLVAPGLAPILSVGRLDDARPFVAAEYLTGQTLAERIARTGSLHINEARPIFLGVISGLSALHKRGLLHGDVKAENVFVVRPSSEEGRTEPTGVLVDAGADRLLSNIDSAASVTGLLPVLGTAKAIAPEQARGGKLDQRTDVYQMGTLMYEALAGRPPFQGDTAIDVVAQQLTTVPQPPSAHARKGWVSEALDAIVLKALAKDPAERYQSAAELARALEGVGTRAEAKKPLDEAAFGDARRGVIDHPEDATWADALEELAGESGAWSRVAEALQEGVAAATETEHKLALLSRVARIYDGELKEATRAEAAYQQILELDEGNAEALRGLEAARRAAGDHEGLLELLLDRVESEQDADARQALLREVASIYDQELGDKENACVAYAQALISDPSDAEAARQVERLAGNDQARWGEVLEMLNQAAQEAQAAIFTDEEQQRAQAQQQLEAAQAQYDEFKAAIDQNVAARAEQAQAEHADADARIAAAEEQLESLRAGLPELEQALAQAAEELGAKTEAAEAAAKASDEAHAAAEAKVEEYETLDGEGEEEPDQEKLDALAAEAEQLVEEAGKCEQAANETAAALEAAREALEAAQAALDGLQAQLQQAEHAADELKGQAALDEADAAVALTPQEQESLDAAQAQLDAAQEAMAAFESRDDDEVEAQRERDLADLAETYVLMGRWYGDRIHRADFALSCYGQALAIDPAHAGAYDGVIDLYRSSQSWNELAATLLQRADADDSPVKARDYRAEAAVVLASKLGDTEQARAQLEAVLDEDPAHPTAQEALADIVREQHDWAALAAALEVRTGGGLAQPQQRTSLVELAHLYEGQLDDVAKAEERYQSLLELDPRDIEALKGLERIYIRTDNAEKLLSNLRAQVEVAPTPRQRIDLLERVGMLLEQEFVNHSEAAQAYEDIVAIDAGHPSANAALARLYRHLQRFEDAVEALDRQAAAEDDEERKIELMLQAARTFAVDIGSPDRAMDMYEEVLSINELQAEALSELARLRSISGDAASAVQAVDRLAEQEQDPHKKAQLWIRAGKLLADAGDRDSAMARYKKALDLDKLASEAAEAMREIYAQRGDARGAADMLIHAVEIADGDLKRASLLAELGQLYRDELQEDEEAKVAFEQALELDPTSSVAASGLAAIAFAEGENETGVEYFEEIGGRLGDLAVEIAAPLCIAAGDAYKALGNVDKAVDAYKRARDLMPDDLGYSERHAQIVMESEDFGGAERLYDRILKKFDEQLDQADRKRLLLALGEAQLAATHSKRAIETFSRITEELPEDPDALEALTRAHEAARNWTEVVNLLQLRSRRTTDEEAIFDLLVQTGDVFLEKIRDRDAASQTYVMALDVKPDSRNLLTKLMGVYSDAHDWPRLIEVILRISEMVTDSAQLAKYFNTAASIAHMELGRFDEAANYYEEALAHMGPTEGDQQFEGLVACLTENQDWERLERAYESRVACLRDGAGEEGPDNARIAALLDARAEIIQNRLGRLADALALYEEALALEPENERRRAMLTATYTKEPKRFFERAVAAHRHYLEQDPYRVESLQALRKIYTSGKRPDESWCMCQALRCLKQADVDEEKFFKKYRLTRLAKTKQPVTDELWRTLVIHPVQDPMLTAIFATLSPAVVGSQSQQLAAFGVSEQNRIDPIHDTTAMGRMLAHVAETMTTHLPPVYDVPHDGGGLSFLFSNPPAIGIGQGAKAGGPQQALAFVAGRHLSYFRPGHYVRQLVPTGTGLRAWLLAAIRSVAPNFPVPPTMEQQVKECVAALGQSLGGPQRDALRSMTQKLLEAAPELDMKAWMAGVDLTADRIGFVLSNDLKIANAVIEASPEDASSVGRKDRMNELLAYSTSEHYFELRKRIGIALGG